ncbi:MAG TPA: serine--tRNA ligase [bacterium]|nr:serine--tRNA ligase [bacterium]
MFDLKLVRDNPEFVRAGIRKKHRDPALVDAALDIDRRRRELLQDVERYRADQNRASGEIARLQGPEKADRIAQMREVAARLKALEPMLKEVDAELTRALLEFPNLPHESVPPGNDERENVPLRYWGEPPQFQFQPLDHLDLGTRLDIIDVERAAKVSGARFYYLRGAGVLLEQALMRLGMDMLVAEGFTPVITPFAVRPEIIIGAWGGADLDVQQVYQLEGERLALIGTSEQSLAGMYSDETLDEHRLPLRLAGISWNFRREAGSYGRDVRGLYRVHQFDKLEMFSITAPETSWDEHEYLVSLEERILQRLGLPYRVVAICGGDTSAPSAKTYDLETWMPGREAYGETQSCSNCTDFQARRLGIRVRRSGGTVYPHTLNGTAIATSRALIAVLENYQQGDGTVRVPEALVPYMNGLRVIGVGRRL